MTRKARNTSTCRARFANFIVDEMRTLDRFIRENYRPSITLSDVLLAHLKTQMHVPSVAMLLRVASSDLVVTLVGFVGRPFARLFPKKTELTGRMVNFLKSEPDFIKFLRGSRTVDLAPIVRKIIMVFVPEEAACKALEKIEIVLRNRTNRLTSNLTRIVFKKRVT